MIYPLQFHFLGHGRNGTAHMQIPAGDSRQGSAEKLTDGEWLARWPIKDLLGNSNPRRKFMQDYQIHARLFCGQ
jgi:hypothetical protein